MKHSSSWRQLPELQIGQNVLIQTEDRTIGALRVPQSRGRVDFSNTVVEKKVFIYNWRWKEKAQTVCDVDGANYIKASVSINVVVTAEIEHQSGTAGLL